MPRTAAFSDQQCQNPVSSYQKPTAPPLLPDHLQQNASPPALSRAHPIPTGLGYPKTAPTSLTASIFPLIASIRPAKNRKMAPCNDTREDPCASLGTGGMEVPSRGGSHLGVSAQVGFQQPLCLCDVDIPSTWRWQGGTVLRLPLLGPVRPLATCRSLLGPPPFPCGMAQ